MKRRKVNLIKKRKQSRCFGLYRDRESSMYWGPFDVFCFFFASLKNPILHFLNFLSTLLHKFFRVCLEVALAVLEVFIVEEGKYPKVLYRV